MKNLRKDMNVIVKGYTQAMKWLKNNVNCDTFNLSWYEIGSNYIMILVKTVTTIDMQNQVENEYFLKVDDNGVTWKN